MSKSKKIALVSCCLICLGLLFTACSNKGDQAGPKFQAALGQAQWKAFGKADSLLNAKLKAQSDAQTKEDKQAGEDKGSAGEKEDSEDFEIVQYSTLYEVNMRSGPSTDYDVVDLLDADTLVEQTGPEEEGWLPVSVNGMKGYVRKDLLTPASEMPASARSVAADPAPQNAAPPSVEELEAPLPEENQFLEPDSNDGEVPDEEFVLAEPEEPPALTPEDELVIITKNGDKYHKAGCSTIKNSKETSVVSLSYAQGLGRGPCKRCH